MDSCVNIDIYRDNGQVEIRFFAFNKLITYLTINEVTLVLNTITTSYN